MRERITVPKSSQPIVAKITIPGSKSITNRALPMAALADGVSTLTGVLFSDDSRYFLQALQTLGYQIEIDEEREQVIVHGQGVKPLSQQATYQLFIGNSGTSMRFLTAMVSLGQGTYELDGVARMRQRPMQDMIDALSQLSVTIEDIDKTGCPPLRIQGKGLAGGTTKVRGTDSSQFLTGLLLAAPYAQNAITIEVIGELVSEPYVVMTIAMMEQFGVKVSKDNQHYLIPTAMYHARHYAIEPDASGASYFMAAAAVTGGRVKIMGLTRASLQGDTRFVDVLEAMGCEIGEDAEGIEVIGPQEGLQGIDVDLFAMSDLVPTLAAIAPLAKSPVTIRNVSNIRLKETDRIAACVTELRKFGVTVEEYPDGLKVYPCSSFHHDVHVHTYEDHRIAMAFSILGMVVGDTHIEDPGCVAKTFPDYFDRLFRVIK
nr:3-phosphoshikimate 1-carboxyvinyltransferase [Bacilli bacterium]